MRTACRGTHAGAAPQGSTPATAFMATSHSARLVALPCWHLTEAGSQESEHGNPGTFVRNDSGHGFSPRTTERGLRGRLPGGLPLGVCSELASLLGDGSSGQVLSPCLVSPAVLFCLSMGFLPCSLPLLGEGLPHQTSLCLGQSDPTGNLRHERSGHNTWRTDSSSPRSPCSEAGSLGERGLRMASDGEASSSFAFEISRSWASVQSS